MKKQYVELLKIDPSHSFKLFLLLYMSLACLLVFPTLFYLKIVGQEIMIGSLIQLIMVLGFLIGFFIRIALSFYNFLAKRLGGIRVEISSDSFSPK